MKETNSCSCETCMCDLQLAICLKTVHNCPTPLFGVLDREDSIGIILEQSDVD